MRYTTLIGKIRPKHAVLAAALLSPPAALLVWHAVTEPVDELRRIIVDLGFSELVPPSTVHLPGTINTVEFRSDGSVQLHPTCVMDREVLAKAAVGSVTTTQLHRQTLENGIDATADLRETIGSAAVGEKIRSVRLSLEDMRILFLSDEALIRIQKEHIKDECQAAILHNLSTGARVCQREAVLRADAVYRIDYRDELASAQQVQASEAIAASLELFKGESETDEIRGDDLFYGIRLKRYCIVPDGGEPQGRPQLVALGG